MPQAQLVKQYRIPKGSRVYPLDNHLMPLVAFDTQAEWYFWETDIIKMNVDTGEYIAIKLPGPVDLQLPTKDEVCTAFAVGRHIIKLVEQK